MSSIWINESKETRLVWITIIALKDAEGRVYASVPGLADRAKVSIAECQEALRIMLSPDPHDSSGVEDGRKIRAIPGGWEVVNHDLYRFSTEAKREFWRQQKAEQRAREDAAKRRKLKNGRDCSDKNFARRLANGDAAAAEHADDPRTFEISNPDLQADESGVLR